MKIGELASATGLSTRAIRYYENIGLLPEPERMANGYRRYHDDSVARIGFIRDAQSAGLALAEIGMILDMKDHGESTCGHVIFLLEQQVAAVDRQIDELRRAREELEGLITRARGMDPSGCRDPNRCQTLSPTVPPVEWDRSSSARSPGL